MERRERNRDAVMPSNRLRVRRWCAGWGRLAIVLICLTAAGLAAGEASAGTIFVTHLEQRIQSRTDEKWEGGCSLQEAIFAANFDDNIAIDHYTNNAPVFVRTGCLPGSGDDVIVLPTGATLELKKIVDDAFNPFGPTATPIITSHITIEAHGATLQFIPSTQRGGHLFHSEEVPVFFRAFSVGSTGHLTLRHAVVRGFVARGGNGGFISDAALGGYGEDEGGGGGGMGAGGAIFVHAGGLTVEGCTFEGNGAIGGDGAGHATGTGGGGGGGLGGWGGPAACEYDGGGGGGSRGYGVGSCAGDGGGTLTDADNGRPGYACGGLSGWRGNHEGGAVDDGEAAPCAGGGGGAGGGSSTSSYNGGKGNYGGGGGGGGEGGDGADGGFGGGGGAGYAGTLFGSDGGNGGFGGGGGAGPNSSVTDGDPGNGGLFGGNANHVNGGGGAALGGAIFSDYGRVDVRNSTFTGNFVTRGNGGSAPNPGQANNGRGAGAAIFSVNGNLSVVHCTISGNEATGFGGGVVVVQYDDAAPTSFTLENTIIASNGPRACSIARVNMTTRYTNNLVQDNDTSDQSHPFDSDWSGCGDVVSDGDPLLGPLQANQGPTPTMALSKGSPAVDVAAEGLPTDQRGQARPSGVGFDLGAFELCLQGPEETPCLIVSGIGESDPTLTMQVSPEGGGTTTPGVGSQKVPMGSVIVISAVPAPGHRFLNWSSNVTSPSSLQTTVIVTQDTTVTANFELLPDFTVSSIPPLTVMVGGSTTGTVTANANAAFINRTVTWGTSGLPLGFTRSFSPTSVSPAASTSASSQMTVSAGLSVLSGSYSFSVNGSSGSLFHSTPVSVEVILSPAGVAEVIGDLVGLGCVDSAGVGNAFSVKLAQAQAAIAAGDTQTAINLLQALLQQLQAQAGKHLKTTCIDSSGTFNPVQVLIDHVSKLLQSLGVSTNLKPNPVLGSVLNSASLEIAGATVNLLSGSRTIAQAVTDATGFYVFPKTSGLKLGMDYTLKIVLPKGYKSATPASQTFRWNATMVTLQRFVLK